MGTESLFALVVGYLLGSIPFGLLLTRFFGAGDLRQIGSGNIGATNVLRTGRKELAAATLLLDAAKGVAAVFIGEALSPGLGALTGAAAFIGHLYPVWIKFRGGKGLATMIGIAFALKWQVGLAFAVVWLAVAAVSRISSLSGLAAAVAAPAAAFFMGETLIGRALAALAILTFWKHRDNISRLRRGIEPKIGQKEA